MATTQLDNPGVSSPLRISPPRFIHSLAFWTFVTVAIGVAWRTLRFLLQFPIWGDESFVCVNFLDNSYLGLVGPLRIGQICPVTFLWTELALYHWLGPSELVMRLVPFLCGLGALALFGLLARRVLSPVPASLALALLAVSYYPVRHAVEVKPYAQDLLVALALLVPAALYILNPAQKRWVAFLACFVPLAVFSSYPAVLMAGSISLVLLPIVWRRPERPVKYWFVLYNALLAAAFLGNYFLIGKPQLSPHVGDPTNAFNSTWHDWFPSADPIDFLTWFLKAHTGNMLAYPVGGPDFASSLSTLLCLAGVWSWWRSGNRQILALLACPFLLSMAAAVIHKYPYGGSARLDQHLAPAICLFMGNGVYFLINRFAHGAIGVHKAVLAATIFLAVFGTAGMIRDIVKPFKTTAELWNRDFVHDLMARLEPGDRVVIFHPANGVRPGLEWYFHQYPGRIIWNGDLNQTSGKIWCLQFDGKSPHTIPETIAGSGLPLVQTDYFQSLAPPEHGDNPELAQVYCYIRK